MRSQKRSEAERTAARRATEKHSDLCRVERQQRSPRYPNISNGYAQLLTKTWRRLDGHNQLPKIIRGVKFADGCEVITKPDDLQSQTAAA
jgi:hypothetical protein